MFCHQALSKVKEQGGGLTVEPLYCRAWTCRVCRHRRRAELKHLAQAGYPTTFLTLTVNPKRGDGPDDRARKLTKAWRALRAAMCRNWPGEKFPFLAVFERTKKGEPHLHILMRAPFIKQAWISERMARLTGAPIVDIRYVRDPSRATGYITKYVSKAPERWEGCKRYWRSQDWKVAQDDYNPEPHNYLWLVKAAYEDLCRDIHTTGMSVCDVVRGGRLIFYWWTGHWRELRQ